MLKRNFEEQSGMDIPNDFHVRTFSYTWKDRSNDRVYSIGLLEDGQLLSYTVTDKDGMVLYKRRYTKFDRDKNLWFLPTSNQPLYLNFESTKYYDLGTARIDPGKNEKRVIEEEEEKSKEYKVIWYSFHDEHNKRNYEVGFHIEGDLVGYCTSESTKNECLHQVVSSESCENCEEYKMEGKLVLVNKCEQDSSESDSDRSPSDLDVPLKKSPGNEK